MKKIILFAVILILLVFAPYTIAWAGEKEELQWKAKALIAEFQLAQKEYQKANDALKPSRLNWIRRVLSIGMGRLWRSRRKHQNHHLRVESEVEDDCRILSRTFSRN